MRTASATHRPLIASISTCAVILLFGACTNTGGAPVSPAQSSGRLDKSVSACQTSSQAALEACRPLKLSTRTAAETCGPTSVGKAYGRRVLGPGPIYAVTGSSSRNVEFVPATEQRITSQPGGPWFIDKVLWLRSTHYSDAVLIRIAPVGHPADARIVLDKFDAAAYIPHSIQSGSSTGYPSYAAVTKPGCYVWQIDGRDFSYRILFRAYFVKTS